VTEPAYVVPPADGGLRTQASHAEAAVPAPTSPPDLDETLVIEDGVIPRRLRRPLDLARFVLAILITAAIVLVAYFATETAAGLDTDLTTGAALLPSLLVLALNVIGGLGTLGLPIAAAVMLVLRGRVRVLFDALVALLLAIILLTVMSIGLTSADVPRLLVALAGSTSPDSVATAPILGGLLAFVTVSRLMGRRPGTSSPSWSSARSSSSRCSARASPWPASASPSHSAGPSGS
jgi:hypothetical protein